MYYNRKLPRLSGFDYSSENYYFVTICTRNRKCLFGDVGNLNELGLLADRELRNISKHFPEVRVDCSVVMPNHIHAVIVIGCAGDEERSRPFPTLSQVVGSYKSGVTRLWRQKKPGAEVWQKSFYDRVLRREDGYLNVIRYIEENPLKWELDKYYESRS